MTEAQLRQDVIDEFEFDPSFSGEHVGVAVDKNVVTLSGHVSSYAEKLAAIAAARRVKGVHAIAENIEVRYPCQSKTADDQIAQRASDILNWDVFVPANAVDVLVQDGWVTLTGDVDWYYERTAAADDIRKLSGVIGVTNNIRIKPHVEASDIRERSSPRSSAMPRSKRTQSASPCRTATRSSWKGAWTIGMNATRSKMRHGQLPGWHPSTTD